eukprot:1042818-Prymnesium_polylepis.1
MPLRHASLHSVASCIASLCCLMALGWSTHCIMHRFTVRPHALDQGARPSSHSVRAAGAGGAQRWASNGAGWASRVLFARGVRVRGEGVKRLGLGLGRHLHVVAQRLGVDGGAAEPQEER